MATVQRSRRDYPPVAIRMSGQRYPSGVFSDRGEHLKLLSNNGAAYVSATKLPGQAATITCIVIPTNRSILKNSKNIKRIFTLAETHGAAWVLFLCSGEAKRQDLTRLAATHENVNWIGIDGPFAHDGNYDFKTTHSPIAYGSTRDVAQKRNFALLLARLMQWENIFLLDDDIELTPSHLAKAAALLDGDAAVVGFSAREYPDHSVVVHASSWAHTQIDTFVGGGALGIKTNAPYLSFFPHIYNDDWLFLLLYCLQDQGGLTWAGTTKQKRFNPFRDSERARSEEPGDLLAESLMRLAMAMKIDRVAPMTPDTILALIGASAGKKFWEHEINQRVLFIRNTQDIVRHKKIPSRKKRQALQSLAHAVDVLTGVNGLKGLEADTLAAWTKDWIDDNTTWNILLQNLPACTNLEAALAHLGYENAYTYSHHGVEEQLSTSQKDEVSIPPELEGLPKIPRSPERLRGLRSTKVIETFHRKKGMSLQAVIDSASTLRFDRPIYGIELEPALTICILVANGEAQDQVGRSVEALRQWLSPNLPIQIILWVYDLSAKEDARLRWYRDSLVAQVIPEIAGSNIRLRSVVLHAKTNNLDHFIDDTLSSTAMAYWLEEIEGDQQVFVVNSQNELLRKGTLWEFVQQQHTVPSQPLQTYLQSIQSPTAKKITDYDDEQALAQARRNFATTRPGRWWPWLGTNAATRALVRCMKRAGLSWLALDDVAYEMRWHLSEGQTMTAVSSVYVIPIVFNHPLTSDIYVEAKSIIAQLLKTNCTACMVVVYGKPGTGWQQMLDFRKELMDQVRTQYERPEVICISLVCHPDTAHSQAKAKLVAGAAIRYFSWILNYHLKPTIRWHKD